METKIEVLKLTEIYKIFGMFFIQNIKENFFKFLIIFENKRLFSSYSAPYLAKVLLFWLQFVFQFLIRNMRLLWDPYKIAKRFYIGYNS